MNTHKNFKYAFILAIITIGYNIFEGVVSIYFGFEDETLALFGFGIDSFVEVISGVGISHMILRIQTSQAERRDHFEKTALKITACAFFLLTFMLVFSSLVNLYKGTTPHSTFWGIVISSISIMTMGFLIYFKLKVGKVLHSQAILADARCTLTCLYLSFILLLSSGLFYFFHISWADSVGALGLAVFSFKEGKEAWKKSVSEKAACC